MRCKDLDMVITLTSYWPAQFLPRVSRAGRGNSIDRYKKAYTMLAFGVVVVLRGLPAGGLGLAGRPDMTLVPPLRSPV